MKDRLETAAIAVMLIISIVLSMELWFQPTIPFSKEDQDSGVLLEAEAVDYVIVPSKTLINFNDGNHTISYENKRYGLWEDARGVLEALFSAPNIKMTSIPVEEYTQALDQPSIQFSFSLPINTLLFPDIWQVEVKNDLALAMPQVEALYISIASAKPEFILVNREDIIVVSGVETSTVELAEKVEEIRQEGNYNYYYPMHDYLGVENTLFIPHEMDSYLPKFHVSSTYAFVSSYERGRMAERILGKSTDQIRQISESSGNYLYVLDQQLLKFDSGGEISYTAPVPQNIKDRNLLNSLTAGVSFMYKLHTEPEPYYISDIVPIEREGSQGYQFNFRYLVRGIPVLLAERSRDSYIEMEVFDNQVTSFVELGRSETSGYTSSLLESRLIKPSFEIIDQNFEMLKRVFESEFPDAKLGEDPAKTVLEAIEDINLAYLDRNYQNANQPLNAVWVIQLGNRMLCFDAYNGVILYEK